MKTSAKSNFASIALALLVALITPRSLKSQSLENKRWTGIYDANMRITFSHQQGANIMAITAMPVNNSSSLVINGKNSTSPFQVFNLDSSKFLNLKTNWVGDIREPYEVVYSTISNGYFVSFKNEYDKTYFVKVTSDSISYKMLNFSFSLDDMTNDGLYDYLNGGDGNGARLVIFDKNANIVKSISPLYKGLPESSMYPVAAQGKVFCVPGGGSGPAVINLETGEMTYVEYPQKDCYSTTPVTIKSALSKVYFGNMVNTCVYSSNDNKFVMFGTYVFPGYDEKLKLSYIRVTDQKRGVYYKENGDTVHFSKVGYFELLPDGSVGKEIEENYIFFRDADLTAINFTQSYENEWFSKYGSIWNTYHFSAVYSWNNDTFAVFQNGFAKLVDISTTGIKPLTTLPSFSLYPNPATNSINMHVELGTKYQVTDMTGKTVLNDVYTGETIDISSLKTGVYFIKVIGYTTQKLIKN